MVPVDPRGVPAGFYDAMDLSAFPPETRFLSFRQSKTGVTPVPVITVYSPEEGSAPPPEPRLARRRRNGLTAPAQIGSPRESARPEPLAGRTGRGAASSGPASVSPRPPGA